MEYDEKLKTLKPTERKTWHSERQIFDEVRIKTMPRWKESHLSGDEWRISAYVEFLYKGQVIWEQSFRDCETAVHLMYGWFVQQSESKGLSNQDIKKDLCDQEGCSEKAIIKAYIKKKYCIGGGNCGSEVKMFDREYLQFCDRHSYRGDCDLQDADDNYEKISITKEIL